MIAAYNDGISALSNATLLALSHPEAPIAITSDASDAGVGACLEQIVNGHWQPLPSSENNCEILSAITICSIVKC